MKQTPCWQVNMFTLMDLLPYIHAHVCACTRIRTPTPTHQHVQNEQDGFHYALPSSRTHLQGDAGPCLAPQLTLHQILRRSKSDVLFNLRVQVYMSVTIFFWTGLHDYQPAVSLCCLSLSDVGSLLLLDERSRLAAWSAILNLEGLFVWMQRVGSGIPRPCAHCMAAATTRIL